MALTDMLRGRQVVEFMTNKSGGTLVNGDVVIIDTGNDAAFTTTTSGQSTSVLGVVQESIANNATGRVCTAGYVPLVNVPASVTRGHFVETHTVAKQATGNSARRTGTFGRFLTGGTTPTAHLYGQVDVVAAGSAVSSDTIWDAAGDLAVGTGADTAARLAIGNAGGAVSRVNGAVAWNSSTSFPTAATGDRIWRTDLAREFYYDGTRWLSTQVFMTSLRPIAAAGDQPLSATAAAVYRAPVADVFGGSDIWLERWQTAFRLEAGSGPDGSHNWVATFILFGSSTTVATQTIDSGAEATWRKDSGDINALVGTDTMIAVTWTKTGTPGTLFPYSDIFYRLVAT